MLVKVFPYANNRWNVWILLSIALTAAVVAGIVARLWIYFAQPPLWGDEVMLHMNLLRRGYRELAMPLDYGQMAPVLFLWLQKVGISIFGPGEQAVRMVPLLCGIVTIGLVGSTVTKCTSWKTAGICAAALASISPALIQYSNQAKQYIVEAATTAFIVWLCVYFVWKNCSNSGVLILLGASIVSLLLSIPSIFVVACAWASFALVCRTRGADLRLQLVAACAAAFSGAVFAALYFSVYAGTGNGEFMQRYWRPLYLSAQQSLGDTISLAVLSPIRPLFSFDEKLPVAVAAVAALMIGFGVSQFISEKRWPELILFCGPLVLVMGASLASKWPLGTRLMVFSAPLVVIMICKGIAGLVRTLSGAWRQAAVCLMLIVLLVPALKYDLYQMRHPAATDNREVVSDLIARAGASTVYIYSAGPNGALEWLLYSEDWRKPNWKRVDKWLEFAKNLEDSPRRLTSGSDMVYRAADRWEIIGLDSGTWAAATGYSGDPPDSGWADGEADRIVSTRPDEIYVFAPHYRKPPLDQLFASLQRRGLRLVEKREGLTRWYRFAAGYGSAM